MITQYLTELLYEHNCVILPGFGGFIANRLPSKINEVQQRVEPARKVVVFNINLIQNDGLLATHVSNKQSISYDKASQLIVEFVSVLKTDIQLKRHRSMAGIGDFYLNSEDKIVFIPEADINFAKDSFGLFPITIRKILRDTPRTKTVEKEKLRSQPIPFTQPQTKRSRKLLYSTLLIALPLALGFFTQQSGILQKADINLGDFFKSTAPVVVLNETVKQPVNESNKTIEIAIPENSKTETPTQASPTTTVEVPKPDISAATNAPAKTETVRFHIIGGSFGVPQNAQKFTQLLVSKGFKAYIAGTNATGLAMVSYAGFASESEAQQFLQKIQQSENTQAWLLNK